MDNQSRPSLAVSDDATPADDFIAELQAGIDRSDASLFNNHFAADVLWGTPFGGLVDGYDQLHPIHTEMLGRVAPSPGSSTYVVDRARRVTDDVVVAYVRRIASDHDDVEQPGRASAFDELALLVMVRRDDTWWLAAGQHVPDRRVEAYGSPG